MPAANERALEKAKGIPADAIIFDLEDAVSPDAKDLARAQAIANVPGEEGKVMEVIQAGYSLNDRVIRPAMVKVGQNA